MTVIYLIRHAEAEGNLYRRIQGHWNGQVTPRGQKQIDALAERFWDVPIGAVFSSDLQRTIDTAGAILKYHDLQLETTPRLREANLGVWEGRPWGDVEYASPEQMYYFNHDPAKWDIPQCEHFPEVQARMRSVLAEIAARYDGQTVAVVSHGVAIRSFLASALGVPSEQIDTLPHGDNTAVSCLRYDGGALTVEYYNDASHLPEELSTFGRQTWWKNKGADAGNLRFEPLQFPRDSAFFDSCYSDAWAAAHGSTAGYTARPYLRSAKEHAKTPHAVVKLLSGDKVVGMIDMTPTAADARASAGSRFSISCRNTAAKAGRRSCWATRSGSRSCTGEKASACTWRRTTPTPAASTSTTAFKRSAKPKASAGRCIRWRK